MTNRAESKLPVLPDWVARLVVSLPWVDFLIQLWKLGNRLRRGLTDEGMYEALHYESTLELADAPGTLARYSKYERVRYLHNNIIAFQDQIWSDGQAPLNYRCSPGIVVDQYRPAQTTILLISLRQRKQRGETDDYYIQWDIGGGFLRAQELWQTTIYYDTRVAVVRVIFLATRPPQKAWGSEETTHRVHTLPEAALQRLPDGRWQVQWAIRRPRRNERYNLHWLW